MAHFMKPIGAPVAGYQRRGDGSVFAMTIPPASENPPTKVIVLWGGGAGGEILKLAAIDAKGRRLATTRRLGLETGHKPNKDRDHEWFFRYELKSVVEEGKGTLFAMDAAGKSWTQLSLTVASGDVSGITQRLPGGELSVQTETDSVNQASVLPWKLPATPHRPKLTMGKARAFGHEMRFEMVKDGITFWVGAFVPEGTTDYTRAHIFFHPDTLDGDDNVTYPKFTGKWPGHVSGYVQQLGVQLATVQGYTLLVPFMTQASRSNTATTNMFATRGIETINALLNACRTTVGEQQRPANITRLGVSSFSSGVNHLFRFGEKIGASGLIKEQIDFDGAFIVKERHKEMGRVGARNKQVTQMSPNDKRLIPARRAADEWLQLDSRAWPVTSFGTPNDGFNLHNNIGNFMFRAMMQDSSV